jgi:hypothetical protein
MEGDRWRERGRGENHQRRNVGKEIQRNMIRNMDVDMDNTWTWRLALTRS